MKYEIEFTGNLITNAWTIRFDDHECLLVESLNDMENLYTALGVALQEYDITEKRVPSASA